MQPEEVPLQDIVVEALGVEVATEAVVRVGKVVEETLVEQETVVFNAFVVKFKEAAGQAVPALLVALAEK